MRVDVRCPDCNRAWQIESSATGEMLCPNCMTRIPLGGAQREGAAEKATPSGKNAPSGDPPQAVAEAPVASAPSATDGPEDRQSTVRDMRPEESGTQRAGVPAMAPASAAAAPGSARGRAGAQVVCPRCQLHFRPKQQPSRPSSDRKTILVVDDLAYFRKIAEDALQHAFDVKTAATSDEARDLMAGGGIDLLVLDLTLDGCNAGRDLLLELQPKPCPILIFTAQDESEMYGENWEDLRGLGADDLVIKGMKVAESLVRKVSTLLGSPASDDD